MVTLLSFLDSTIVSTCPIPHAALPPFPNTRLRQKIQKAKFNTRAPSFGCTRRRNLDLSSAEMQAPRLSVAQVFENANEGEQLQVRALKNLTCGEPF